MPLHLHSFIHFRGKVIHPPRSPTYTCTILGMMKIGAGCCREGNIDNRCEIEYDGNCCPMIIMKMTRMTITPSPQRWWIAWAPPWLQRMALGILMGCTPSLRYSPPLLNMPSTAYSLSVSLSADYGFLLCSPDPLMTPTSYHCSSPPPTVFFSISPCLPLPLLTLYCLPCLLQCHHCWLIFVVTAHRRHHQLQSTAVTAIEHGGTGSSSTWWIGNSPRKMVGNTVVGTSQTKIWQDCPRSSILCWQHGPTSPKLEQNDMSWQHFIYFDTISMLRYQHKLSLGVCREGW
jgi:hypothetical protein